MARMGRGWKECGFDTPNNSRPRTRKAWLEIYVGRCHTRLADLHVEHKMTNRDLKRLRAWLLDPDWIGEK